MASLRKPIFLAALMVAVAIAGVVLRPSTDANPVAPRYQLEELVPKQFGDWRELPQQQVQVVNPQTKQLLDKLYSQILTRNYVNAQGYQVMVSVVYGGDQRGGMTAHKPEVCYPAQGFKLHSSVEHALQTSFGDIATRRLSTSLGARQEPITYWFTVGDKAVRNKFEQRLVEIRLGLTGQVPDGLLFRVSSIDGDTERAYRMQEAFVKDLLATVPPLSRTRLSGLGG